MSAAHWPEPNSRNSAGVQGDGVAGDLARLRVLYRLQTSTPARSSRAENFQTDPAGSRVGHNRLGGSASQLGGPDELVTLGHQRVRQAR